MLRLSVTEMARNFSSRMNDVQYRNKSYELLKNGRVVAHLLPMKPVLTLSEWARRRRDWPHLEPDEAMQWEEELVAQRASIGQPEEKWDS